MIPSMHVLISYLFSLTGPNSITDLTNSSSTRGCRLGDQFHSAGSSWHPYLPPNGYDTCAVCTCDPMTLEIQCPRVQCPSLNCNEKVAFRPDKKACCKKCPNVSLKTARQADQLFQ